jgi:hypothetical protein
MNTHVSVLIELLASNDINIYHLKPIYLHEIFLNGTYIEEKYSYYSIASGESSNNDSPDNNNSEPEVVPETEVEPEAEPHSAPARGRDDYITANIFNPNVYNTENLPLKGLD